MIHLYGNFTSHGSFREVSDGMEMALRALGRLSGRDSTDQLELRGPRDDAHGSVALLCGNPGAMRTVCMFPHRSLWLLLAPNSFGIPKNLASYLLDEHWGRRLTGFLAPSHWACDVLRPLGLPVIHAPHGVESSIMRLPPKDLSYHRDAVFEQGGFNVAHVTSSDKQRKGTRELLEAWRYFEREAPGAQLLLYGNAEFSSSYQRLVKRSGAKNVHVALNTNNPKATIVDIYHSAHVVAQPSRAEGFGLVPLEALACGTPIVATSCSGHADYLDGVTPGAVVVPYGPLEPSDDFDGAVAYSVSSESILNGLREAHKNWKSLSAAARANASNVTRNWSWTRSSKKALEEIDKE